ncbi:EAL domain-containing protein [Paenibacillus protaetiae]|nr:EAL domain-containing protein [Paenibacillus protaetiae]
MDTLDVSLKKALAGNGELSLIYGPVYGIESQKLDSFHVKLLWNHPELGDITCDQLMAIAERNGMTQMLGQWMLHKTCERLEQWQLYSGRAMKASLKICLSQLEDKRFCEGVLYALQQFHLDPGCLAFELELGLQDKVTDHLLFALTYLRARGVRIHLAETGTNGHSDALWRMIPATGVKLSPSLIGAIHQKSRDRLAVSSMIEEAHRLGLRVTAEGVICREHFDILQELGCDCAEGMLFGKPDNPEELDIELLPSIRH